MNKQTNKNEVKMNKLKNISNMLDKIKEECVELEQDKQNDLDVALNDIAGFYLPGLVEDFISLHQAPHKQRNHIIFQWLTLIELNTNEDFFSAFDLIKNAWENQSKVPYGLAPESRMTSTEIYFVERLEKINRQVLPHTYIKRDAESKRYGRKYSYGMIWPNLKNKKEGK